MTTQAAEAPNRDIVCSMKFVDPTRGNRMFVATDQAMSKVTYRTADVKVSDGRVTRCAITRRFRSWYADASMQLSGLSSLDIASSARAHFAGSSWNAAKHASTAAR